LYVESLAGFLSGRFGFQPSGLSETPLYNEKSLEHTELDLKVPFAGIRVEVALEGGFGLPAIDMARDMLIFILHSSLNNISIARASLR
jgi:hypothetical protein